MIEKLSGFPGPQNKAKGTTPDAWPASPGEPMSAESRFAQAAQPRTNATGLRGNRPIQQHAPKVVQASGKVV